MSLSGRPTEMRVEAPRRSFLRRTVPGTCVAGCLSSRDRSVRTKICALFQGPTCKRRACNSAPDPQKQMRCSWIWKERHFVAGHFLVGFRSCKRVAFFSLLRRLHVQIELADSEYSGAFVRTIKAMLCFGHFACPWHSRFLLWCPSKRAVVSHIAVEVCNRLETCLQPCLIL